MGNDCFNNVLLIGGRQDNQMFFPRVPRVQGTSRARQALRPHVVVRRSARSGGRGSQLHLPSTHYLGLDVYHDRHHPNLAHHHNFHPNTVHSTRYIVKIYFLTLCIFSPPPT